MSDDILDSDCQAIVNTVNCEGVMGAGLARQFKLKYPEMFIAYQRECREERVSVGEMYVWAEPNGGLVKTVINFPTKIEWRRPSQLWYIIEGLQALRHYLQTNLHITSIAIPPLGCGLGGLRWNEVEPLIRKHLGDLGIRVDVYPPNGSKYTL